MKKIVSAALLLLLFLFACSSPGNSSQAPSSSVMNSSSLPPSESSYTLGEERECINGMVQIENQPKIIPKNTKVKLDPQDPIKDVDISLGNVVLQTTQGKLIAWGLNEVAEFGLGHNLPVSSPVQLSLNASIKDFQLGIINDAGYITETGEVYAIGENLCGQYPDDKPLYQIDGKYWHLNYGTPIKQICLGNTCFFALSEDGRVFHSGWNFDQRFLDHLYRLGYKRAEVKQFFLDEYQDITPKGEKITYIGAHNNGCSMITSQGEVYVFGGIHSVDFTDQAHKITFPTKIKKTFFTGDMLMALGENGVLYGWGQNYGMLPQSVSFADTPVKVLNRNDIADMAAGTEQTIILTQAGEVWIWGRNLSKIIAEENIREDEWFYPEEIQKVPFETKVVKIFASTNFDVAAAITEDGHVWLWGCNLNGLFLNGTTEDSFIPVRVTE